MKRLVMLALAVTAALAQDGARYLVITADAYYDAVQPLVEWRRASGLSTLVVRTSETGTDTVALKTYVRNAWNNWTVRPEYILLVGSGAQIQSRYYPQRQMQYPTWTDNAYADMTGDMRPEIAIGRLPATSVAMAQAMVNKVLTYERNPNMVDSLWMRRLTGIIREGQDNSDTVYWNNVRRAAQQAAAAGFVTVDSLSYLRGHTANDVINAANRGTGFIVYRGSAVGTWYSPFGVRPSLDTAQGKLPIVVSATCQTLSLTSEPMLSDSWMRTGTATLARGAVAFFGNTHTSASDVARQRGAVCRGFFDGIFVDKVARLGPACVRARQQLWSEFPTDTTDYRGFNLLGDPAMRVWTATPVRPVVEHAATIEPDSQSFAVTVTNGVLPVGGAEVCVSMDSAVYAVGTTDASGQVSFDIAPHEGQLRLVVSGKGLFPYDVLVPVALTGVGAAPVTGPRARLALSPNPTRAGAIAPGREAEEFVVYDCGGRLVQSCRGARIGAGLPPGVYSVRSAARPALAARLVKSE
jgi:hypothetical protein